MMAEANGIKDLVFEGSKFGAIVNSNITVTIIEAIEPSNTSNADGNVIFYEMLVNLFLISSSATNYINRVRCFRVAVY